MFPPCVNKLILGWQNPCSDPTGISWSKNEGNTYLTYRGHGVVRTLFDLLSCPRVRICAVHIDADLSHTVWWFMLCRPIECCNHCAHDHANSFEHPTDQYRYELARTDQPLINVCQRWVDYPSEVGTMCKRSVEYRLEGETMYGSQCCQVIGMSCERSH